MLISPCNNQMFLTVLLKDCFKITLSPSTAQIGLQYCILWYFQYSCCNMKSIIILIAFVCNAKTLQLPFFLRLRVTENVLLLPFLFSFSFSFLSVLSDGLAKVIVKCLSNCCFECVWPRSELIIWYAVRFQPMSSRYKQ